ncbi:Uncharacterised protein [Budvicia aquatica]|uniref:Uncharacterized protein n=1 Tax=Budvicia aquatica TaxID=82979 RepID=A0A484ZTC5_9GAMM|nr:hypothetical protein [Budvicia aquatica]VFS51762.1 Uncharacterised protein [Budvicia aquatica]
MPFSPLTRYRLKLVEIIERLRGLKDSVKADDIDAKFKAARDQAIRSLRDKSEIYEDGGNVIKLGPRHRFSVNTQELDLTILPRGEQLYLHLTGTDYQEPIESDELETAKRVIGRSRLNLNHLKSTGVNISPTL